MDWSSFYLGCYADYYALRDLRVQIWPLSIDSMNIDYCITKCLSLGYALAGLQASYISHDKNIIFRVI